MTGVDFQCTNILAAKGGQPQTVDTMSFSVMNGAVEEGEWGDWKECPTTTLAVGIIAKTNMLKLEGLGRNAPKVSDGSGGWHPLNNDLEAMTVLQNVMDMTDISV